jgi:hypothetical protein
MCSRALDYLPPVDLTFGEYLRGLITADYELVRDDTRNYRVAVIEAFRRRGIYPDDIRTLSVESLRWNSPILTEENLLKEILPPPAQFQQLSPRWDIGAPRQSVFRDLQKFQSRLHQHLKLAFTRKPEATMMLGLDRNLDGGKFEVHSLRPARRIGPDGQQVVELIVEITQRQPVFFKDGKPVPEPRWDPDDPRKDADFWFRGGCTLLIDPKDAAVRYVILKRITNSLRLQEQANFISRQRGTLRADYFGLPKRLEESELFAMLHRGQPKEAGNG